MSARLYRLMAEAARESAEAFRRVCDEGPAVAGNHARKAGACWEGVAREAEAQIGERNYHRASGWQPPGCDQTNVAPDDWITINRGLKRRLGTRNFAWALEQMKAGRSVQLQQHPLFGTLVLRRSRDSFDWYIEVQKSDGAWGQWLPRFGPLEAVDWEIAE